MAPMPAGPSAIAFSPSGDRLQRLRDQIDRLLASDDAGVYGVDATGRATLVTPAVAEMTGHSLGDLVGHGMHERLHHSHPDGKRYLRDQCPIYAAFRDGEVHRASETFWRKDGSSFPIEFVSTPLTEAGRVVGAVVVFRDVERRRQLRGQIDHLLRFSPGPHESLAAAGGTPRTSLVGRSPAFRDLMALAARVAPLDTTVLLVGESGTGKEPLARAIHEQSPRRDRPLVAVNCAAIPSALIESELFGHERGAFTGATQQRIGRFEQAADSTLLLDEIGELSLEAQAKLLRVLQERAFERVGGTRTLTFRARVIAATNRDLPAMVAAGKFRADLLYRLMVFPISLPPLRQRRDDIPLLVRHFLDQLAPKIGRRLRGFSTEGMARLTAYDWPGNVRELQNLVERAALLADGSRLQVPAFTLAPTISPVAPGPELPGNPRDPAVILSALESCGWKVTGPQGAAAALGIHPNTLRYRMRRLHLQPLGRGSAHRVVS
ncbi:MAG TPA: sigma 54-interacting transcriptional regulator [Polyangia bacterium]